MDGGVALQQGLGESGGASGHKHAAPTGLGGLGGAIGCQHPERMCAKSSVRSAMLVATTTRGLNPKAESPSAAGFGLRISELGLLSALGFRPSDFKGLARMFKEYYEYQ